MKTIQRKDITDKMVVKAYAERKPFGPWAYEILAEQTGSHENVAYAACERAFEHGLIEYGTSLRSGWLTDKGKALL